MGINPSFFIPKSSNIAKRQQLVPQITQQVKTIIRLYYETHHLIKEQYKILPEKAIIFAKKQANSRVINQGSPYKTTQTLPTNEEIKESYKYCVSQWGKYILPYLEADSYHAATEHRKPLIPGLLEFYKLQLANSDIYYYPFPLKKPKIQFFPVISKKESDQCMKHFLEKEVHGAYTQSYTLPLVQFNLQQIKPRLQGILKAQYELQNLYNQYIETYSRTTNEDINTIISEAYEQFHRQRARNNTLYFVTTPIHWPIQKIAHLMRYIIEQHWVACIAAAVAVITGAAMLSFGFPPAIALLWNVFNTGIILNPTTAVITSCALYGAIAFLATTVTVEVLQLTRHTHTKMQQKAIKEAQAEIRGKNLSKDNSYKKVIEKTSIFVPQGSYKPSIYLPDSTPPRTWKRKLSHYFSHKYDIVDDCENSPSDLKILQPSVLRRG